MTRLGPLVFAALFTALGITRPLRLLAWGPEGHHIIARIAWAHMTPDAKRAAIALLGSADAFVAAATWPDEIRSDRPDTLNWHFVNIPYDATTYDAARDCQPAPAGDCVIAAIARERADLANASLPADARRDQLKFLIHFVGDLHQPLHAIDNHDHGGGAVHVTVVGQLTPANGQPLSLHVAWDTTLLAAHDPDEQHYTAALLADIETRGITAGPIDVVKWAEGSHRLAIAHVYTYRAFSTAGPTADIVPLDAAYQREAQTVITNQLELGGLRLAAVLNEETGFR